MIKLPSPVALKLSLVAPEPLTIWILAAAENDIRSYHANLRVGIDVNERTKQERVVGLDRGQLCLQRGVAGLQAIDLVLQISHLRL
jgi:hypothetical protein